MYIVPIICLYIYIYFQKVYWFDFSSCFLKGFLAAPGLRNIDAFSASSNHPKIELLPHVTPVQWPSTIWAAVLLISDL